MLSKRRIDFEAELMKVVFLRLRSGKDEGVFDSVDFGAYI